MNYDNLKVNDDEAALLAWCYDNLDEAQVAEIEEEAIKIAAAEINAPEAADRLLPLLVQIITRNASEGGVR